MENKWLRAALPALLIHGSIGTVYAWSVFKQNAADYMQIDVAQLEWAFSLAIFCLGMSAAALGHFVERDIKQSALLSTVLFTIGMAGTGWSIYQHSLVGIYIFYGVIMGIGLGVGYLTPVKNLMLWFHENKGLGTGLAVAGFGLSKMIFTPVMTYLMASVGIWQMFVVLAVVFAAMMLIGTGLIRKPASWVERPLVNRFQVGAFVTNRTFIGIWLMFYLNITAGLAIISQEKDILAGLTDTTGVAVLTAGTITTLVSIDAFWNAAGRIGFASWSDRLHDRNSVYKLMLALQAGVALLAYLLPQQSWLLVVVTIMAFFLINAAYGGGFSSLPPLLSDRFGMRAISKIHGLTLSAWAIAGLSGNQLASFIRHGLGLDYHAVFLAIAGLYGLGFLIAYWLVKPHQMIVE